MRVPEIFYKALAQRVSYNPETGVFIWNNPLTAAHSIKKGDIAGTNSHGYRVISSTVNKVSKCLYAHILAWYIVYNEIPDEIDHIYGVCDDNRISQLRKVTRYENSYNRKLNVTNTSGRKGVSFSSRLKKWEVYISYKGKRIGLGYFKSFNDACTAREKAEIKYHKQFSTRR